MRDQIREHLENLVNLVEKTCPAYPDNFGPVYVKTRDHAILITVQKIVQTVATDHVNNGVFCPWCAEPMECPACEYKVSPEEQRERVELAKAESKMDSEKAERRP